MKDKYIYGLSSIVAAVVLGLFIWFSAREIRTGMEQGSLPAVRHADNQPAGPQMQPPQPPADPSRLTIKGSPFEGKEDAPVTMIECSDFQCPFCARFAGDTLGQLRNNEIKAGIVKLVFKNFPLPFHQFAEKAAEAAECANKQGKFWQMHDKLFQSDGRLDTDSLKSYAQQIGLDTKKFDHCLDSGETAGLVNADKQQCASAGVQGTPTFFINGKMLVGAQPYDRFKSAIEQARH